MHCITGVRIDALDFTPFFNNGILQITSHGTNICVKSSRKGGCYRCHESFCGPNLGTRWKKHARWIFDEGTQVWGLDLG